MNNLDEMHLELYQKVSDGYFLFWLSVYMDDMHEVISLPDPFMLKNILNPSIGTLILPIVL